MDKPRPYKAGYDLASSLTEVGHILYLMDNRKQFLQGIKDRMDEELITIMEGELARKNKI